MLRLRESLNNTARNVVYEDNRRIAKILQGFVVLRTEIDLNFERFMRHYIGYMTFEETRAYSAPLAHLAGNESLKLQKIYHPMIIIENRATQFQFLFDSIKFSLDLELLAITKALQAKPEAKACWLAGKEAVEMLIKAIGVKVDEVFRVETRDSKPEFEMIGKSVEQLAPFIEGNYGRRCVNEDIRSQMTRCVWESVSLNTFSLKLVNKFIFFQDERSTSHDKH